MIETTISRYMILDRLDGGGSGWLARSEAPPLDRDVVVNLPPIGPVRFPKSRERFVPRVQAAFVLLIPTLARYLTSTKQLAYNCSLQRFAMMAQL
jgi:hypothetical protein